MPVGNSTDEAGWRRRVAGVAATSHPPGVTAGHTAPSGAPPRHLHLRLCPEALIGLVALLLALWPTASPVPPEPPASLRLHWRVPASLRQLRPRLCITPALLRPSAPSTTSPATRVVALPAAAAERRRTSPKHCQRVKLTTPITLGHLPAGSVEVHLRHPRLASVGRRLHLPAFGQRRLTLRLEPAHQLRLRLVDVAGKAVVGAQVQVHPGDAARERTGQALAWQTESDARGRVRFTQLPAGPLELTVQGRGLQRRRLQRTVARRAKTETLVLAPEARLHGRIYEPSGAPAARVQVAVSGMHLWPPRHTESDAAGRLRLGGLPPGPVQVLAWRGSWVGARDRDLVLQRQHTTRMHLRLEPGRSLVLALRDGRGQPVRGARITVHEAGSGRGRRWARSDARGRAVLAGLRRRPLRLQVQAPGFLPHSRRLDAAQAGRVALTLQRSAALRLRLISPRGHGIADAQVELIPLSAAAAAALPTASIPLPQPSPAPASSLAALASSADNLGTTPAAVPAIPLTPPDGESGTPVSGAGQATPFDSHATAPHFETAAAASSPTTLQVEARRGVSDAQGQVRLHTLAPGRYQLHARQARWLLPKARTLVLRAGAMRKLGDVVLRATGALALKVVDADGRALAGVAVHAAAARYGLHADSRSDARGQLQLAPLLGPVALTLAPPWTMPPLTLTVPAGQRLPHTLRLQHSACILSGRVRGADGQPLGGAHIALQTADGQRHHTQSRPSGHWQLSLPGAPQGQLRIRHATHVPWQGTVPACHRIVQLQLAAGVTLRASLRDAATDRPIAGATATLTRPGPGPAPPAVHSDADGSVRFAPVGAGAYTLHVQHPHYPGWQQPLHLTTRDLEHQARTLAPVELPPGASVRGQVVDRFGVAAAGMHVRAIALNEKTGVRSSATRDDGRFGLHGLPAGPVRLEVYDDAGTLWHQHTLSLEAGDTLTDLRLRLVDLRLP